MLLSILWIVTNFSTSPCFYDLGRFEEYLSVQHFEKHPSYFFHGQNHHGVLIFVMNHRCDVSFSSHQGTCEYQCDDLITGEIDFDHLVKVGCLRFPYCNITVYPFPPFIFFVKESVSPKPNPHPRREGGWSSGRQNIHINYLEFFHNEDLSLSPPFIYLLSHYFSIDVPILSLVYHPISHYFMAQIVLYLTSESSFRLALI